MDISDYTVIPVAAIIINQIVLFARRSLDKRQPVWRALIDIRSEQSPLIAFTLSLVATSLIVGGGLNSVLLPVATAIFWLSWLYERDNTKRTNKDHAWTAATAVISSFAVGYSYWEDSVSWLLDQPSDEEARKYLYVFIGLTLVGFLLVARMQRKKMRKLPTSRQLQRVFRTSIILPAVTGVVVSLLQTETVNEFLTQRVYTMSLFAAVVIANIWAYLKVYRQAPARLAEEKEHFIKEKKTRKRKSSKRKSKKRK